MPNRYQSALKQLSPVHSARGCAISLYYFPQAPQNTAHRDDAILLKDIIRDTRKKLEAEGKREAAADIERLSALAEQWARDGKSPHAVFACAEHGIFDEMELSGQEGETKLHINSRFHLGPLAEASRTDGQYLVVLADSVRVRFVRYAGGQLETIDSIESDIPRKGKSDGFGGYDAGHNERHVENWEMRHFKEMADTMQQLCERDLFEGALIACLGEHRPEIEPHLHAYVTDRLLGFIEGDPANLPEDKLRDEVERAIAERRTNRQQALISEVMGEAKRNGRGTVGLKNVLSSIERGEVQTLLLGKGFDARAIECTHCGHLDTRSASECPLCQQPVREVEDLGDALVSKAAGASIEVVFLEDEGFAKAGNIGALLRFRADQNTSAKLAG